jgi:hypothetical protein
VSDGAERVEATLIVRVPAAAVFAVVSDPAGHVRIDGSGMLVAAPDAHPVHAVGDQFVMDMDREPLGDLPMGRYEVVNTVTRIVPDELIEWNVGTAGRSPIGHVYGFELRQEQDGSLPPVTRVTSYCDWSGLNPKLRGRVTFPVVPVAMLESTLDRLRNLLEQ